MNSFLAKLDCASKVVIDRFGDDEGYADWLMNVYKPNISFEESIAIITDEETLCAYEQYKKQKAH